MHVGVRKLLSNADTVVVLTVAKKHTQAHGSSYFGLSHDHSEAEAVQHAHEWIETHIKRI